MGHNPEQGMKKHSFNHQSCSGYRRSKPEYRKYNIVSRTVE
jgi:hypothetical protein